MRKILIVLLMLNYCLPIAAQVGLQTGSAEFSLPMFNWQDDKSRLNAMVALSYNSGNGLKVNDVASNVGQGWNLLAGGVITRMQIGEPDDQMQNDGDGTIEDVNKYPPGYLYNPVDAHNGCPIGITNYPIFGNQDHLYKQHNTIDADRELDRFAFQFNGRSGIFVLGKYNGDKGVLLGDSKVKIWFQRDAATTASQHIRTTITAFYIKDENGLIYTFSQPGLTKLLRTHPNYPGQNYPNVQPIYREGLVYYENNFDEIPLSANPYKIDSWYLTQIQDPLTQRKITIKYTIRHFKNSAGDAIKYISSGGHLTSGPILPQKHYIIISHNISVTQTPVITSLQCPDGHAVTFNYDTDQPRVDFAGDYPVKSIDITYNNRNMSSYQLNTTYFIFNGYGTPRTRAQRIAARLCLRSVTKVGVDLKEDEPPYVFDYYLGSNATEDFVPPPFYYVKDIWGFYNGNNVNNIRTNSTVPLYTSELTNISAQLYNQLNFTQLSTLCFMSNNTSNGVIYSHNTINPGYAKNGLLKSITYPARQTLSYEYQQNISNYLTDVNHVIRSSINSNDYTGGVHVSKVTQGNGEDPNNPANSIVTAYNYVDASGTTTSQWGVIGAGSVISTHYRFALDGAHHPVIGSCYYDFMYPGILSREVMTSISDRKAVSVALMYVTNIISAFGNDVSVFISTGNPMMLIYDVLVVLADYLISDCEDGAQEGFSNAYVNSNVNDEITYPVQFSRVEVVPNNNSQGIGKTVYEFTDFSDYPLWIDPPISNSSGTNPLSKKQRFAYWAYGLPRKITVFDNSGKILKQTENIYNWDKAQVPANVGYVTNCRVKYYSSLRSNAWTNFSDPGNVTYTVNDYTSSSASGPQLYVDISLPYTGRVELTDKYERSYKSSNQSQYLETSTHYDYNVNNYQLSKITTTQSNGDKIISEKYYSIDYNAGGALQRLVDSNIINVPVATYSAIQKNGSATTDYLGAEVNEFTILPNNDIKVSKSHVNRSMAPATGYTFNAGNPLNFPALTEIASFRYDDVTGKLIGMIDEGGHVVANVYGYDDKYIIASVVNTDPLTDRYAYTSFESFPWSGWKLNGNANYVNAAVTGVNSFVLSGNSLTASLIQGKSYRLTFWATGTVTISGGGATLITSGPINNGFTYYEYEIAAVSPSVTVSGNGNIDEVRLYPQKARMRTVSYDPLIGKTSECDENNRITYYEYDSLGRLRFIKDENRNIIKMYEYNFKK